MRDKDLNSEQCQKLCDKFTRMETELQALLMRMGELEFPEFDRLRWMVAAAYHDLYSLRIHTFYMACKNGADHINAPMSDDDMGKYLPTVMRYKVAREEAILFAKRQAEISGRPPF